MKIIGKISFSVLIFFCLLSHSIFAQQGGWQSLEWGMELEEVLEEYPNAVEKDSPSRYQDPYGIDKSNPIRLESYKLVEIDFFVDFVFNENKLVGVVLGADDSMSMSTKYSRVVNGLTSRYGEPYISEKDEDDSIASIANIWESEDTQIRANYIPLPMLDRYSIRLSYWMVDDTELDKF